MEVTSEHGPRFIYRPGQAVCTLLNNKAPTQNLIMKLIASITTGNDAPHAKKTPPVSVKTRFTREQRSKSDSFAGREASASTSPCNQPTAGRERTGEHCSLQLVAGRRRQCHHAADTLLGLFCSALRGRSSVTSFLLEGHTIAWHAAVGWSMTKS